MVDWMPSIEFVIFVSVSVIKNITQISRRTMNNRWRAMALVAAILDHFLQFPYEYQCIGMRLNVEAHEQLMSCSRLAGWPRRRPTHRNRLLSSHSPKQVPAAVSFILGIARQTTKWRRLSPCHRDGASNGIQCLNGATTYMRPLERAPGNAPHQVDPNQPPRRHAAFAVCIAR